MTARAGRQAFIALNLAIAMALFLVGHSFLGGMTQSVTLGIDALGSDTVMLGDRQNDFVNSPAGTGLDGDDLAVLRDIFGERYAMSGAARTFGEVVSADGSDTQPIYYIDESFFAVTRVKLVSGRAFSALELARGDPVCLASEAVADGSGAAAQALTVDGQRCEIIGTVAQDEVIPGQSLENAVFRPLSTLRERDPSGQASLSTIYLRSQAGAPAAADLDRMREYFRSAEPGRDDMVWSGEAFWNARESITRTLSVMVTALTLLLIGMAATGLSNALLLDVMSRRTEIGLRMALGATPADILKLVAVDGARVALAGGGAGLGAAALLITFVLKPLLDGSDLLPGAELQLGAGAVLLSLVVLGVATVCAVAIPAAKATRIDPSLTLRNL